MRTAFLLINPIIICKKLNPNVTGDANPTIHTINEKINHLILLIGKKHAQISRAAFSPEENNKFNVFNPTTREVGENRQNVCNIEGK